MKNFQRKTWVLYFLAFSVFVVGIARIHLLMVDGFYLSNIHLDVPFHKEWQIQHTASEQLIARTALSQPFHYLGKGTQSYVFESEDGQYILKFIKCQRLRLLSIFEKIPLFGRFDEYRKKKLNEKSELQKTLFTSYVLAKEKISNETQVIFAHLNTTPFYEKKVTLFDKAGFRHEVAIDDVPFVLQKKVSLIFPTLTSIFEKGDKGSLKAHLDHIVRVFYSLYSKGVQVEDANLITRNNLGFFEDKASFIDIGSFAPLKIKRKYSQKTIKSLEPIHIWLQQRDLELAAYFKNELNKLYRLHEETG